ncbi:hypothetical protein N3930_37475, partial [Bacillus thuringiensis]|nr:hypothetical protein [Bacillus thuringiensis]
ARYNLDVVKMYLNLSLPLDSDVRLIPFLFTLFQQFRLYLSKILSYIERKNRRVNKFFISFFSLPIKLSLINRAAPNKKAQHMLRFLATWFNFYRLK